MKTNGGEDEKKWTTSGKRVAKGKIPRLREKRSTAFSQDSDRIFGGMGHPNDARNVLVSTLTFCLPVDTGTFFLARPDSRVTSRTRNFSVAIARSWCRAKQLILRECEALASDCLASTHEEFP